MPIDFQYEVNSGGSCVVVATYTDEDGSAVTPSSVTWTLHDEAGKVVNSRSGVSETPGTSNNILLSGADVTCTTGQNERRRLTVSIVYDSSYGSDIPQVDYVWILVKNPPSEVVSA